MFRDLFAGIRDMIGGRSGSYEKVLRAAKTEALEAYVFDDTGMLKQGTHSVGVQRSRWRICRRRFFAFSHASCSLGP